LKRINLKALHSSSPNFSKELSLCLSLRGLPEEENVTKMKQNSIDDPDIAIVCYCLAGIISQHYFFIMKCTINNF